MKGKMVSCFVYCDQEKHVLIAACCLVLVLALPFLFRGKAWKSAPGGTTAERPFPGGGEVQTAAENTNWGLSFQEEGKRRWATPVRLSQAVQCLLLRECRPEENLPDL